VTEEPAVSSLSDEPALTDALDRGSTVAALEQVVRRGATPMVLGVFGTWGVGKTSAMRQLEAALGKDDDCLTVWFDPWQYQFEPEPLLPLVQATMDQLGLEKSKRFRNLISVLSLYGFDWLASTVGMPSVEKLREYIAWVEDERFRSRSARGKLRNAFSAALEEARLRGQSRGGPVRARRIVFFIDDLDRCEPGLAVALLESLKLHLNIEGCVFVIGIDPAPIEDAVAKLRGLGEDAASDYLDKIIQLPFRLPPLTAAVRESYVERLLAQLGGEPDRSLVRVLATAVGENPRRVKRTVNMFAIAQLMSESANLDYKAPVLGAVVLLQLRAPAILRDLADGEIRFADLWGGDPDLGDTLKTLLKERDRDLWRALDSLDPALRDVDVTPYVYLTTLAAETVGMRESAKGAELEEESLVETARLFPSERSVSGAPALEYDLSGRHISEKSG
jgi:hypothetical protein